MSLSSACADVFDRNNSNSEVSSSRCFSAWSEQSSRYGRFWSPPHELLMEQGLWGKLPVELIERIIGNLPIDAMLRARSVCKAWKSYISSYGYAHLCYRTPSKGPWCLAVFPDRGEIVAYDVTLDIWHHLPRPHTAAHNDMHPFSIGANLVCFKSIDNSLFFVYNPLTKSCSPLTPKRRGVGLDRDKVWVVTDESEGFTVIVVKESGHYQVFDSYSNRWSKPGKLAPNVYLSPQSVLPSRSVSIDGILYLITGPLYDVVTYDTITGSWSRLYVPWPEQTRNHILSEYRGRIYLLALQKENEYTSFSEWELHSTRMSWVKVETMPKLFSLEIPDGTEKEWQIQCLANRNLVVLRFTTDSLHEILVLYNRDLKLWSRISNIPMSCEKH